MESDGVLGASRAGIRGDWRPGEIFTAGTGIFEEFKSLLDDHLRVTDFSSCFLFKGNPLSGGSLVGVFLVDA